MTEEIMTVEQHIEELRAELRGITDPIELRQVEAELQMALSKAAELEATIDPWPD
jgi:predicted  nucleic acid-binding Zn-ribbon protein